MSIDRRDFLKKAGLVGLGTTVVGLDPSRAVASSAQEVSDDWMGVLVDLPNCIGCRQCEAACRAANGFGELTDQDLRDKSIFIDYRRPGPHMYTTVNRFPGPDGGEQRPVYVKTNCFHCNDPACVSACLVGAFSKKSNGAVLYDAWKCMGCRYCNAACPFQIPAYEYDNAFTPQVRKCTLCQNEGNPNRGGIPACVQNCPKECLAYGKRSDLLELAHDQINRHPDTYIDHVYGEHEVGGTSWLYLSSVPFEELNFLHLGTEAPPRLTEAIQHSIFKHWMPPVAWFGMLGIIMHLSRPEHGKGSASPEDERSAASEG